VVPFTPSDVLPTSSAVPEFPTAVPADVCPGEVPSSRLPLSFENEDVAPNEDASVVVPAALGERVPGTVDAWFPVVTVVLLTVLEVLDVPDVPVAGVEAAGAAVVVVGAALTVDAGAVIVNGGGVTFAAGVVVVVVVVVDVADVAAISGATGVKRVAIASATVAAGDFGRGRRMAELLSDRCPVRSDALQCVCQRA
jgi:hypothetical protein